MNQSIIVYRNPIEQMFWEGICTQEFWICFAVLTASLAFGCYVDDWRKYSQRRKR